MHGMIRCAARLPHQGQGPPRLRRGLPHQPHKLPALRHRRRARARHQHAPGPHQPRRGAVQRLVLALRAVQRLHRRRELRGVEDDDVEKLAFGAARGHEFGDVGGDEVDGGGDAVRGGGFLGGVEGALGGVDGDDGGGAAGGGGDGEAAGVAAEVEDGAPVGDGANEGAVFALVAVVPGFLAARRRRKELEPVLEELHLRRVLKRRRSRRRGCGWRGLGVLLVRRTRRRGCGGRGLEVLLVRRIVGRLRGVGVALGFVELGGVGGEVAVGFKAVEISAPDELDGAGRGPRVTECGGDGLAVHLDPACGGVDDDGVGVRVCEEAGEAVAFAVDEAVRVCVFRREVDGRAERGGDADGFGEGAFEVDGVLDRAVEVDEV
mmetsp:Transcript_10812/g.27195  ORF Transcript_10812/g.27195 Transcript_10812/m.27195 type:complete len:377 (-) Transcript_10812:434-1564(-)